MKYIAYKGLKIDSPIAKAKVIQTSMPGTISSNL